jgi:hypothetical protein
MNLRKLAVAALSSALVALAAPMLARADVVYVGPVDMSGTGFGNVNTIMTMQATGTQMGSIESGCVGVSDSGRLNTTMYMLNKTNKSDPDLCQGGNVGGYEKSPSNFPHNQTFLVTNAAQIGVVFNSNQPAGGTVSLSNLVFVLFDAHGNVIFTSGATSQTFSSTASEPGIGNSGWEFILTASQAAQAQAAINANGGSAYLGLSATVTDSYGGPETFFLVNAPSPSQSPEPATLLLLGTGMLLLGAVRRRFTTTA